MLNTKFTKFLFYYGCGVASGAIGGRIWHEYRFKPKTDGARPLFGGVRDVRSAEWSGSRKAHDAHVHFSPGYSKNSRSMKKFIALLDKANLGKAVWMPIPTNIHQPFPFKTSNTLSYEQNMKGITCGNSGRGMHYYLPQKYRTGQKPLTDNLKAIRKLEKFEQYYDLSVDDISAMEWKKLTADERERIMVMIVGFHLTDANSIRYIVEKIRRHPGVFMGVGEISAQKEIVSNQLATKYKPSVRSPVLGQLFDVFGYIGFPVVFHCDIDDFPQKGGEPAHFQAIKSFFIAHPKTTIIWAHAGGLGRFVKAGPNHLDLVEELLQDERCAHVHIDLSWDVVAESITNDRDTARKWAALIERFPDRFLYGSDSLETRDEKALLSTYAIYEAHLFPLLTDRTADRVKRENFDRIFSVAGPRIRHFEKAVLPTLSTHSTSNDWIGAFDESKKNAEKRH